MNNPITYGKIFKRYRCLNNTKMPDNYYNPSRLLENVEKLVERKANDKIILNSIQEGITDVSNSNINEAGFGYITKLISTANNIDSKFTFFTNEVTENVIPYLLKDGLDNAKYTVEESDLQDWQKDTLLNAIKETSIIDRILNNHSTIAKRFNLDRITESKDLDSIVESVCTMIDTYDVPIYQKLNLSIEELTYLLGKNNIKTNNTVLVSECTKYYLLSTNTLSTKDKSNIRTTLQESYCISPDDTKLVSYIFEDGSKELESIDDYINDYLLKDNKSTAKLAITFGSAIINARDTDILYNIGNLFKFVYDAYILDVENYNKSENIIKNNFDAMFAVFKTVLRRLANDNSIEYMSTLKSNIAKIYDEVLDKYNHLIDNNRRTITEYFLLSIKDIMEVIDELLVDKYPESNLEAYNYITREDASHITISVAESKSVGLLKSVTNFNSKWKEKSKQFAKKVHAKFVEFPSDMKKFIIGETTSLASLITEDKRLDCTVMKMELEEGCDYIGIHKFFNSLCEEYNLLAKDEYNKLDSRAYYEISSNIAELHIAESSIIDIDDKDIIFNDLSDPMLLQDVKNLNEVASFCDYIMENLEEISNLDAYLATKLNESSTPLSVDEYELVVEALSIMNAPESTIKLFSEKYLNSLQTYVTESGYSSAKYIYNSSKVKTIEESYKPYNYASIEEYAFCTGVLATILEKKDESLMDKDRKLGEDIKKKNPLKGINFNGIKLVLQGIKNKFKNLSTKEKELSTKIDNNFKNFVSSIKKASVDKKREQIIKNDVVPSLSKCIKTGILLAGVGVFGNPILAAALAIGSFAANRKITAKEKTLICDEIETELQVIDREIANADARNQTKRYRALLTQKKALQREYQRIKYNKNIGKKFYVSPNAGTQVES